MMKKSLLLVALTGLVSTVGYAAPAPGEMAAQTCGACHGTQGKLAMESFPALAGMSKEQFIRAMTDFKSGKRASTLMVKVAEGFTPEEIADMASYFAAQKLD
jgi:sulfide dehydrogenase cytochrome subunit